MRKGDGRREYWGETGERGGRDVSEGDGERGENMGGDRYAMLETIRMSGYRAIPFGITRIWQASPVPLYIGRSLGPRANRRCREADVIFESQERCQVLRRA